MQVAAMDRDRAPRRVHRHYQPVLRHLQGWADGACTTPQVWWHIDALAAEGIEHPAVQRIHALATHIRDQNLCSSLVNLLTDTCKLGNFIYNIPDRGCSVDHCLRPGQMISSMRKIRRSSSCTWVPTPSCSQSFGMGIGDRMLASGTVQCMF